MREVTDVTDRLSALAREWMKVDKEGGRLLRRWIEQCKAEAMGSREGFDELMTGFPNRQIMVGNLPGEFFHSVAIGQLPTEFSWDGLTHLSYRSLLLTPPWNMLQQWQDWVENYQERKREQGRLDKAWHEAGNRKALKTVAVVLFIVCLLAAIIFFIKSIR
jgi:hypothetical protein